MLSSPNAKVMFVLGTLLIKWTNDAAYKVSAQLAEQLLRKRFLVVLAPPIELSGSNLVGFHKIMWGIGLFHDNWPKQSQSVAIFVN